MAFGLLKNCCSTNSSPLVAFLMLAVILTDSSASGQVNVQPNTALLNEGDRTELLCLSAVPINYCRIVIPGEKVLNLSPDWNTTPGFTYHGAGLAAGECGVSIERVKANNNGQVKCNLGVQGEESSGSISLVVALRPQQPIIELVTKGDRDGYFAEGSQFQARCIVRDGRPAANISWYIDDQPADKRVSQLEVEASPTDRNMTLSTTKQDIQWHLRPEDHGRKLICRSHHQTDRENLPPQEGAYLLHVHYAPVRQSEIAVYGLYLDHTALINVTIQANPPPTLEWTIDGAVITQRSQNGRFEVSEPQQLGQHYYNATLAIAGLTLEDTTKTYYLKASNAFGSTDYTVRISSSSTPPSAGLEIGAIVGIVVAVAILVLIVLLIIFARATGRWCFGGKSMKSQTNETILNKASRGRGGQSVALLETPNGVTIIGNKHTNDANADADVNGGNDGPGSGDSSMLRGRPSWQGRGSEEDEEHDDSFEYATDRESSVYNPTTVPLRSVMASAGGRNSQKQNSSIGSAVSSNAEGAAEESADLLSRGSQLGIPESRFARWLPKDQREILEKQAKLLANPAHTKTSQVSRLTNKEATAEGAEKRTERGSAAAAVPVPVTAEKAPQLAAEATATATHLQETEI